MQLQDLLFKTRSAKERQTEIRLEPEFMRRVVSSMVILVPVLAACTPTVRLEAPAEPIEINLNVTINQEVRVRLDREVEDLIADNPDLF